MRLSQFKKGGGFLNNVDGTITGYKWTDQPPGDGERSSKSDFTPLFFVLSARPDGADADVTTSLFAGSADDFEISDDGLSLEPLNEGNGLREGTALYTFLESLVNAGFPESNFPDDPAIINFEPIIGTRVTFVQIKDTKGMERAAAKYKSSNGKFNEKGQRKDKKTGKYYDLSSPGVSAVLALPGADGPKAGKGAKGAKGSTKAKEEPETDELNDEAVEALMAVLENADGSIARAKLTVAISKKVGLKNPNREALRKLTFSEDFLATEQGWSYDKKKQTITAE